MTSRRKKRRVIRDPRTEKVGKPVSDHATVMLMKQNPWTEFVKTGTHNGAETWENSRYIVAKYPPHRITDGFPLVIHLSLKHIHNVAITDFRDFQAIKTALVHPQAMAVQVYPAESQLVDMANQYHLWCFVPDEWPHTTDETDWPWLPVGFFDGRKVMEQPMGKARQRRFESHVAPTDDDLASVPEIEQQVREAKRRMQSGDGV
jgi:hypothetical protein